MFTKAIAASAGIALMSSTVLAGGMGDPIMEQTIIVEETEAASSSGGNIVIPLLIITFIALASKSDAALAPPISDIRTKTDIGPVGVAANGLPLYQYRYIGSGTVFEGVMAQDVLQHTPEAVVTMPGGLMMVNYDMLGLRLRVID